MTPPPMPFSPPVDADASGPAEPPRRCDVLVVGGGPAGSTVSALLAAQGRDVVLMEKARHPRFHIGESLLPANGPLFDRLGVRQEVERIGMPKWGVEFVSPHHDHRSSIEFGDAFDKSMPYAWQVRRSELDEVLFRHAAGRGARTFEGHRVAAVRFDADGATVEVQGEGGAPAQTWRTRFLIDASGRDTLLAHQLGSKEKIRGHSSAAIFGHFTGAKRLDGRREGDISIVWFDHGWFWFIPLADGVTSVGAVCWPYYLKTRQKRPLADFFLDTIALAPGLAERLEGAQLVGGQAQATGNYSYRSRRCTGERHLMIGDAYTFIDPVFSSGVFLAMQAAFDAADLVATVLDRPAEAAAARRAFERRMRFGPRTFSWFIFRVTNPTLRDFFMRPQNPFRVKEALISLFAGDIYGRTPIWHSIRTLKALYYLVSLANAPRSWRAWQRRRLHVRDVGVPAS